MEKVSLEEVLAYREKRVLRRQELQSKYRLPIACLGLNIPGEYKDFPWASRSFHEEIRSFTLALQAEGMAVTSQETEEEKAGYTAFFSIDAESSALKTIALRLEETHPLGRLFDIDIYEKNGEKISRDNIGASGRLCLLCGESAFVCGRNRSHSHEELHRAALNIMEKYLKQELADKIAAASMWAIMNEAAVTPKPGLVDRFNPGSHKDMDFFTFIDSASAIIPWFRFSAITGFQSEKTPQALFDSLRAPGRMAEVLMKKATGGINTHKGYIFSLGILSAAYGRLFRNNENPELDALIDLVKAMTSSLGDDFKRSGHEVSHGEEVYKKSGIDGIRGEVSRGFPSVIEKSLPLLRSFLKDGCSINDAGIAALLALIANTEDTNIIHRAGREIYEKIQKDLKTFFDMSPGKEEILEKAARMDREFINKNISPGGSADLLGVTFFLYHFKFKRRN